MPRKREYAFDNRRKHLFLHSKFGGKSYLLFNIFYKYLTNQGIDENHIIKIALDDRANKKFRDPDFLCDYIHHQVSDNQQYYILLDEVQYVPEFEDVLNSFLHIPNADTYVTGSNAKFLSKDVITEFRGRGDEIKMYPLSFGEFFSEYEGNLTEAFDAYMTYGGLPQVLSFKSPEQKSSYLKNLFAETYIKDFKERYDIRHDEELEELIDTVASSIGGLTNPSKIANTFESLKKYKISKETVKTYLDYLCDSFLVEKAMRYDVKGRKYINTPAKYYFADCGLRNARLNFRQMEKPHLTENIIYNELRARGYNVDVGVVTVRTTNDSGIREQRQYEVDFVCNLGSRRYYIQSAYRMETEEKEVQEKISLLNIDDSFKKIIITGEPSVVHRDNNGITTISIYDFLLNANSLEM